MFVCGLRALCRCFFIYVRGTATDVTRQKIQLRPFVFGLRVHVLGRIKAIPDSKQFAAQVARETKKWNYTYRTSTAVPLKQTTAVVLWFLFLLYDSI